MSKTMYNRHGSSSKMIDSISSINAVAVDQDDLTELLDDLVNDLEEAESTITELEETITSKNMRIQELKSQLSAA